MKAWPPIGLLLLTGCLPEDAQSPSEAYRDCAMAAVTRLDDGLSDPASIAIGVAGACAGQYAQLSLQMQSQMTTDMGHLYMADKMRTNEVRLATNAVLTYRASKRQQ